MPRHRRWTARPPSGPLRLNPASQQARGLVASWTSIGGGGTLEGGPRVPTGQIAPIGANLALVPDAEGLSGLTTSSSGTSRLLLNAPLGGDGPAGTGTGTTLTAWVRLPASLPAGDSIIVGAGQHNVTEFPWCLETDGTNLDAIWQDDGGYHSQGVNASGLLGKFVHVAGSYDGTTLRFWVNGQLLSSGAQSYQAGSWSIDSLAVGNGPGTFHVWPFPGTVTDVRLYARVLPAAELWQQYDPATRWELYLPQRGRRVYSGAVTFSGSGGTTQASQTESASGVERFSGSSGTPAQGGQTEASAGVERFAGSAGTAAQAAQTEAATGTAIGGRPAGGGGSHLAVGTVLYVPRPLVRGTGSAIAAQPAQQTSGQGQIVEPVPAPALPPVSLPLPPIRGSVGPSTAQARQRAAGTGQWQWPAATIAELAAVRRALEEARRAQSEALQTASTAFQAALAQQAERQQTALAALAAQQQQQAHLARAERQERLESQRQTHAALAEAYAALGEALAGVDGLRGDLAALSEAQATAGEAQARLDARLSVLDRTLTLAVDEAAARMAVLEARQDAADEAASARDEDAELAELLGR